MKLKKIFFNEEKYKWEGDLNDDAIYVYNVIKFSKYKSIGRYNNSIRYGIRINIKYN